MQSLVAGSVHTCHCPHTNNNAVLVTTDADHTQPNVAVHCRVLLRIEPLGLEEP